MNFNTAYWLTKRDALRIKKKIKGPKVTPVYVKGKGWTLNLSYGYAPDSYISHNLLSILMG